MKNLFLLALLVVVACKNNSVTTASPSPTVEPVVPVLEVGTSLQTLLVTYDANSTIEKSTAKPALDLMNKCFQSGKLKELWLSHKFVSFNTVFDVSPHTNAEAWNEYSKGAPYALELHWYRTRSPFSSVMGYTYNFSDDDWSSTKSETRIWTNSRTMGNASAKDLAAHWAHELSHQARAGGFVHYTIFDGSTPYEAGDIMEECLK